MVPRGCDPHYFDRACWTSRAAADLRKVFSLIESPTISPFSDISRITKWRKIQGVVKCHEIFASSYINTEDISIKSAARAHIPDIPAYIH